MTTQNQHRPNDFTPVVGAMELADYVIKITDNPNKFPDFAVKEKTKADGTVVQMFIQRQDSLTNWVREQAKEIFMLTFTANEINVTRHPWRKAERLAKQADAIRLCGEHLAAIQLCRKHFHLANTKVKHWGKMTRDLRTAIEGWHEKDKDRYKET